METDQKSKKKNFTNMYEREIVFDFVAVLVRLGLVYSVRRNSYVSRGHPWSVEICDDALEEGDTPV